MVSRFVGSTSVPVPRTARALALAGIAALFVFLPGCSDDDGPVQPDTRTVASLGIDPGSAVVAPGGTVDFDPVATSPGGDPAQGFDASFSSSNPDVATVNEDGVAQGVAEGQAVITVRTQGLSASAVLAVNASAPSVEITSRPMQDTVPQGTELSFAGQGSDPAEGALTDSALVWSSDIDGELGIGEQLTVSDLSGGFHTISLTATDQAGFTATDTALVGVIGGTVSGQLSYPAGEGLESAVPSAVVQLLDTDGTTVLGADTTGLDGAYSFSLIEPDSAARTVEVTDLRLGLPGDTTSREVVVDGLATAATADFTIQRPVATVRAAVSPSSATVGQTATVEVDLVLEGVEFLLTEGVTDITWNGDLASFVGGSVVVTEWADFRYNLAAPGDLRITDVDGMGLAVGSDDQVPVGTFSAEADSAGEVVLTPALQTLELIGPGQSILDVLNFTAVGTVTDTLTISSGT